MERLRINSYCSRTIDVVVHSERCLSL